LYREAYEGLSPDGSNYQAAREAILVLRALTLSTLLALIFIFISKSQFHPIIHLHLKMK